MLLPAIRGKTHWPGRQNLAGGERLAPNEVCAGSAERSGKQQYEGTLQRPEYISRRAARPLGSAPRAFAVSGISCITPMAPFGDTALASKSDSVFATFCTQAAQAERNASGCALLAGIRSSARVCPPCLQREQHDLGFKLTREGTCCIYGISNKPNVLCFW